MTRYPVENEEYEIAAQGRDDSETFETAALKKMECFFEIITTP